MTRDFYMFVLHFVGGGYAYFRVDTFWADWGEKMREVRSPSTQPEGTYDPLLRAIDRNPVIVTTEQEFDRWLYRCGWAFVEKKFARSHMQQWLKAKHCLLSILDTYTDIEVASPAAQARKTNKNRRAAVLKKSKNTCVWCGATGNLTMHHVKPYSIGGETTLRNLVCLCEPCNQRIGRGFNDSLHPEAGMIDISLLGPRPQEGWYCAIRNISQNLMLTRCEVF